MLRVSDLRFLTMFLCVTVYVRLHANLCVCMFACAHTHAYVCCVSLCVISEQTAQRKIREIIQQVKLQEQKQHQAPLTTQQSMWPAEAKTSTQQSMNVLPHSRTGVQKGDEERERERRRERKKKRERVCSRWPRATAVERTKPKSLMWDGLKRHELAKHGTEAHARERRMARNVSETQLFWAG